jgi:hypothetical protein
MALLAGEAEAYEPIGTGVRGGDTFFWLAPSASAQAACEAGASSALAAYGGVVTLANARSASDGTLEPASARLEVPTAALGLQLCYRFQSRARFGLVPGVTIDAYARLATRGGDARAVVARPATISLSGLGVADGDRAYWVPAAAGSCAAPPASQYGGEQPLVGGNASFTLARATGAARAYQLCYRFAARRDFARFAAPALDLLVAEVQAPRASVATVAAARRVAFSGAGLAEGDRAFWLPAGVADCANSSAAVDAQVAVRDADGVHTFTLSSPAAGLTLCYAFGADGAADALPFAHFPAISLTVTFATDPFARASFSAVSPFGAAIGVPTRVTIYGSGFDAAAAAGPSTIACEFDGARAAPLSIGAGAIVCLTPAFASASSAIGLALRSDELEASGAVRPPVQLLADFAAYDNARVGVASLSPAGGPRGVSTTAVTVMGSAYADYGGLAVQFGDAGTVDATLPDWSVAALRATAPYVSLAVDAPSAPTVVQARISLNGVTFSTSGLPFTYYTALVESGAPSGAPFATSALNAAALTLSGLGFVDLGAGAARCLFARAGEGDAAPRAALATNATVLDSTRATCAVPGLAMPGDYTVALSLNGGVDLVPRRFDAVAFRLYETSELAVSELRPAGGPTSGGTAVTVFGRGFRDFGPDQLCCVLVNPSRPTGEAPGCAAAARLLADAADGRSRARCTLPAWSVAARFDLEISLNGGAPGSVSLASGVAWTYYAPPDVTSIAPAVGDADGAELVTITGAGFAAFQRYAAVGTSAVQLRVRFGTVVTTEPPLNYTDTTIVLRSAWGAEGTAEVAVSLNGQQFAQTNASFAFVGITAPRITGVFFTDAGTELVVRFDAQPTDRAGMGAIGACARVFDDDTVATLRGGGAAAPLCYWRSDTELRAQLSVASTVRPGDAITLRPATIRSLAFARLGGSCEGSPTKCANGTLVIDADRPCAACDRPTAAITAPRVVSSCASQRLRLDGSLSQGVGPVPLRFEWRADPARSDHAAELNAILSALPTDSPVVELGGLAAPLQGRRFVFLLRTTSLFGDRSPLAEWEVARGGAGELAVTIDGSSSLVSRAGSALQLLGAAQLASCFPASIPPTIAFRWSVRATRETAGGASVQGEPPSLGALVDRAALLVAPGAFVAGRTYTLRLDAQVAADPSASGSATVEVVATALPLRAVIAGGDRRASTRAAVVVDGSASLDPNAAEPAAGLRYAWTIADADGLPVTPTPLTVPTDRPVLTLPAGALAAGAYRLTLALTKPSVEPASASLALELTDELVPRITFDALTALKYNPSWAMPTERFALSTALDAASLAAERAGAARFNFTWTARIAVDDSGTELVDAQLDLSDLDAVTTTGGARPTLAFRSGALLPNALYSFALEVRGGAAVAYAEARVRMNRPPYGGELTVAPPSGDALATRFVLVARGWSDDVDDLPLAYTFAHRPAADAPFATLGARQRSLAMGARLVEGVDGTVRVTVSDYYDGAAEAVAAVRVAPPPCDAIGHALATGVADAVAIGDASGAMQQLRVLGRARPDCGPSGANASASADNATAYAPDDLALWLVELAEGAAAAAGAPTSSSRGQYAHVLRAVLEGSTLSPGAQASGVAQLAAVATSAAAAGAEPSTAEALHSALSLVLAAPDANRTAAETAVVRGRAIATAEGLAAALLAGTVSGEQSASLTSSNVNTRVERQTTAALADGPRVGADGLGAVTLPPGVFEPFAADQTQRGVDLLLIAYGAPVHAAPAEQLDGAERASTTAALATPTLTIALRSAATGAVLAVAGLRTPIAIELPLAAPLAGGGADGAGRAFNCTRDAECDAFGAGAGVCGADGGCACAFQYSGATCDVRTLCRFWDEAAAVWSTRGCVTLPTPAGGDNGTLYCACDHLTDFAGVSLPTTAAEFERDASKVVVNTLSVSDLARSLDLSQPISIVDNRSAYTLVFALAGACAACLALAAFKDRREARTRAKEMTSLRAQARLAKLDGNAGWRPETRRVIDVRQRASQARSVAEYIDGALGGVETQLRVARDAAARVLQRKPLLNAARRETAAAVASAANGDAAGRAAARERLVAAAARVANVAEPQRAALVACAHAPAASARVERIARVLRGMLDAVRCDHSVLAIFFADQAELPRPVLVQVLFNLVALEVMIACLLLNDAAQPDDDGGAVNLVVLAVNAVVTTALAAPCLIATKLVWASAYERKMPVLSALAAALRRLAQRDSLKARRKRMIRRTLKAPADSALGSAVASPRGSARASPPGSPAQSPRLARGDRSFRSRSPSPTIRVYTRAWALEYDRRGAALDDVSGPPSRESASERVSADGSPASCSPRLSSAAAPDALARPPAPRRLAPSAAPPAARPDRLAPLEPRPNARAPTAKPEPGAAVAPLPALAALRPRRERVPLPSLDAPSASSPQRSPRRPAPWRLAEHLLPALPSPQPDPRGAAVLGRVVAPPSGRSSVATAAEDVPDRRSSSAGRPRALAAAPRPAPGPLGLPIIARVVAPPSGRSSATSAADDDFDRPSRAAADDVPDRRSSSAGRPRALAAAPSPLPDPLALPLAQAVAPSSGRSRVVSAAEAASDRLSSAAQGPSADGLALPPLGAREPPRAQPSAAPTLRRRANSGSASQRASAKQQAACVADLSRAGRAGSAVQPSDQTSDDARARDGGVRDASASATTPPPSRRSSGATTLADRRSARVDAQALSSWWRLPGSGGVATHDAADAAGGAPPAEPPAKSPGGRRLVSAQVVPIAARGASLARLELTSARPPARTSSARTPSPAERRSAVAPVAAAAAAAPALMSRPLIFSFDTLGAGGGGGSGVTGHHPSSSMRLSALRASRGSDSQDSVRTDVTTIDEALTDANLAINELPISDVQKRKLRLALRVMRRTATARRPAYEMSAVELRELFREFERFDRSLNSALSLVEMRSFLRRVGMNLSRDEAQACAPATRAPARASAPPRRRRAHRADRARRRLPLRPPLARAQTARPS